MLRILMAFVVLFSLIAGTQGETFRDPTADAIDRVRDSVSKSLEESESAATSPDFLRDVEQQRARLSGIKNGEGRNQYDFSNVPSPVGGEATFKDLYERKKPSNQPAPEPWTSAPLVLVSFSMPPAQLRSLLVEAGKVGVSVAIKGAIDGDIGKTIEKLKSLSGQEKRASIVIDPTLFNRFVVTRVPAFVLPLEPVLTCDGNVCDVPDHAIANGSVTIRYFLEKVSRVGTGQEKRVADIWLAKYKDVENEK